MASSAYELLEAYVNLTLRGSDDIIAAITKVTTAVDKITKTPAKVVIDSNLADVGKAAESTSAKIDETAAAADQAGKSLSTMAAAVERALADKKAIHVDTNLPAISTQILDVAADFRAVETAANEVKTEVATWAPEIADAVVQAEALTDSINEQIDAAGRARDERGRFLPGGGRGTSPNRFIPTPEKLYPTTDITDAVNASMKQLLLNVGAVTIAYQVLGKAQQITMQALSDAATADAQTATFETLIGNAQQASLSLAELREFAQDNVFSFPQMREAATRLASAGIAAEKLAPVLKAISTVSAATGADISNVIRQYSQAMGGATLRAEELQIMVENNIPVYDLLSASMGKNKDKIRELGREGKLSSDELEKAFLLAAEAGGVFDTAMQRINESSLGTMKAISQSAQEIAESFAGWTLEGFSEQLAGVRLVLEAIAGLAAKLSKDSNGKFDAQKEAAQAAVDGAARAFGGNFGSILNDLLKFGGAIQAQEEATKKLDETNKKAAQTRIELAEGVSEAEQRGINKVVEAQQKAIEASERKFASYWRSLQRQRRQEEDQRLNDDIEQISTDTRAADALRRSLMTPMDEFRERIAEAQELLGKGLITDNEFNLALKEAKADLTDIEKKFRNIGKGTSLSVLGSEAFFKFELKASREQTQQLSELKQQLRQDAERNRILADVKVGIDKLNEQRKAPEVTADSFPSEIF